MNEIALLINTALASGTTLALAALGLLVNERAGVLNLGAEGMMLVAALAGFAVSFHTGSDTLGFAAAALAGASLAALFGVFVIFLNTNQYATGLALSLFGYGLSAFLGVSMVGRTLVGPALFSHHPMVYLAIVLAAGTAWFLYRTRGGLLLQAIGENPEPAHALGYPVRLIRLAAVCVGGALCGLAGAYVSLVTAPLWVEGLTAGRGWIALALTVFATWRPARVMLGAYLFGGVTVLQLNLQAQGVEISSHLLTMLPYLATVVVLALISRDVSFIRLNMPASLGKPFRPGA
jgi:simple sugar transport system permease protein